MLISWIFQLNALIVWRLVAALYRVCVQAELRHLQQRQLTYFRTLLLIRVL